MALIPTLVTFSAGTLIKSSEVNSNFSAIRSAFNDTAVLTDVARTITVAHTFAADILFTDALYDIGKAGATRPRDGFFSRNLVVGGTLGVSGKITSTAVASEFLKIIAAASGTFGTAEFMQWYRADGSTTRAYVGYGAGDDQRFDIATAEAGGILRFSTGAAVEALSIGATQVATFAGRISLTAGQISFPASQNASADVNTLDDYEEGTFTPAISFGGASVGVTYTQQAGSYTKIGNRVYCTGFIQLSNKGSSTGSAIISGLPFNNAGGSPAYYAAAALRIDTVTFTGLAQAWVNDGTDDVILEQVTEAGVQSQLTHANFANTSAVMFRVSYRV
jgi:hypothetical protein